MTPPYFPLRWESTGDQWWYASPIDWAAANGHYDLVRELLHIDPNLLIKLTSLRRIRRLETVWDDDPRFLESARCRAAVARSLLLECEARGGGGGNSLLRAGYGGWLLYTAASAGDEDFVTELLRRDPLMVFGEGEYGVTDILYAAARSKNVNVFRLLFEFGISPRCSARVPNGGYAEEFRWEMRNRAVHAAARGGSLDMVKELLVGCQDVLVYRDAQGSSVLHAASGRGQVEVVKGLIAAYDIGRTTDNQGNTSLHVAAFRGHLAVVEVLITASPTSISLTNYSGDTFLHLAIYGFRTPGFRRLDQQMELMKQLVSGNIVSLNNIINIRNNDGRTVLHMAVIGHVHYNLVALLMKLPSIDLNIRDIEGMTPLDLLNQRPRSATSDLLVRQMLSAGGIMNSRDFRPRYLAGSYPRMHGNMNSPGTSFKISDAEIFLYTGIETLEPNRDRDSGRTSSCSSDGQSGLTLFDAVNENQHSMDNKRVSSAASRFKSLFHWPRQKKKTATSKPTESPTDSRKKWNAHEEMPTPLRQRFSKPTSLQNNKRTLAVRSFSPSPLSKKKFAAGLRHGVIEAMPHLAPHTKTKVPITPPSRSSITSPSSDMNKGICSEIENEGPSLSSSVIGESIESTSQRSSFVSSKLMNQYFCFGAHGLAVEDPDTGRRSKRFFKRTIVSAA